MRQIEFNSTTAASFARLIIGIAAMVATTFGWAFDADLWYNIVISIFALVVLVYMVWWKNQPITSAAQEAQNTLDYLKATDIEYTDGDSDE